MGLTAIPMAAESGPIGGNLSHEFIILAETGESEVFCHRDYLGFETPPATIDFDDEAALAAAVARWTSLYAATSDMHEPGKFEALPAAAQVSARGIEVGHIFYFGTKYSEPMRSVVNGPDGKETPVHMGSYGIGPSRLAAAIIEASHDENGIIWPESVAPFHVGIANLKVGDAATDAACADLYAKLERAGREVLYDDRDERPGAKFATLDLIGLPWQIIVGPKGLAENKVELKNRKTGERAMLFAEDAAQRIAG
jgi:prolyl-tRNA synthetase